jgi:hypothetical protein
MGDYGVNVDYLENNFKCDKNSDKIPEKYISKLVEYDFFLQNELEISKILKEVGTINNYHGINRFLIIQKYDFVKVCETNTQLFEKMNIELDNNKIMMLIKYKKEIETMTPFIVSLFNHNLISNNSIFPENTLASRIFWDIIRINEDLFDDLNFLNKNGIQFLDFSSKNLLFNGDFSIYFTNFKKCLTRTKFNIIFNSDNSNNELLELDTYYSTNNSLQSNAKYSKIEKYIDTFVKIIDNIDYFGNKHFDLYFSKQLIKNKNFFNVFQNIDSIIDDYLNKLYFLQFFSDKFKKQIKLKWKIEIKTNIEQNLCLLNISKEKLSWKLYLFLLLERKSDLVWEIFSLNSLFTNIIYFMIKFFDIQDKTSVVHRYFKYLFTNMDVSSCLFYNNSSQFDVKKCMNNYNKFCDTFELSKDFNDLSGFYCLSHVTIEKQEELYSFLLKNVEQF